jgi:hypothetical protein
LAEAGIEPTRFLPLEPGQQWDCPGPDRRHTGRQVPPTPPETTAPFPAASPTDQPENKEQDDRAQRGVDEEGDYPCAEVDTQPRQQPISDERPDTANDQVANEALAATARDVASKPPGGARFLERMGLNSAVAEKPAQVYQLPTCIAESVTTASSRYQAAASRDEQPISTMAAASPQGRTCAVAISSTGVDGGGHSRILPPSAFWAREPPSIRQRSCSGRQHCKAS